MPKWQVGLQSAKSGQLSYRVRQSESVASFVVPHVGLSTTFVCRVKRPGMVAAAADIAKAERLIKTKVRMVK